MLLLFQDWVQYEEIADVEERVVSNYFENMISSIQSAIGSHNGPASTVAQKVHDTPVASTNDEENVSRQLTYFSVLVAHCYNCNSLISAASCCLRLLTCIVCGFFQMCDICRDPFEQFYDDEEEEWHLRDAMRADGRTYHPVCYEDYKEVARDVTTYFTVEFALVLP